MKVRRDDPSSQNWSLTLPGDSTRSSSNRAETLTGAPTTPTPRGSTGYCTQDGVAGCCDVTGHMTLPLCFSTSARQTDSIHSAAEEQPRTLNQDQNLDQNQTRGGMPSSTSTAPSGGWRRSCAAIRASQRRGSARRTSTCFLDSSVRTLCHTGPAPWEPADRHTSTSTPSSTRR